MASWYLEGYFAGDRMIHRQSIQEIPFIMGREAGLPLTIASNSISRRHAQILVSDSHITIEDMGSKNGTYVNHRQIEGATPVSHGDIIHLGDVEMRLMQANKANQEECESTIMMTPDLSNKFPYGARELEEIIARGEITTAYQAIVHGDGRTGYGYEILGRGTSDLLPKSPGVLFQIAESVGMEIPLSELMRNKGVETAVELGLKGPLFINTHPSELHDPDALLRSISALRQRCPTAEVLLEIHEQAITDVTAIKNIKLELAKMSIMIAYDDFGVGQSRLLELVEATPDVLKFDMILTQDIHLAEQPKIDLVKQLHELARSLKINTLAECVSKPEEYEVCQRIGFDLYQGYLFAEPKYPSELPSVS